MNLKKFFEGRKLIYSIFLGITTIISLIAGILAFTCYHGNDNFGTYFAGEGSYGIWIFSLLLVGVVATIALYVFKKETFAKYILAILSFTGLLLYVLGAYKYCVDVFVGIDLDTFESSFLTSAIFIVLNFVLSIVTLFIENPKNKIAEKENLESEAK